MKVKTEDLLNEQYLNSVEERLRRKKDKEALNELKSLRVEGLDYIENCNFDIPKLVKIPKDNGKLRDIFIYPAKTSLLLKLATESLNEKFGGKVSPKVFSYRKRMRIFNAAKSVQNDMRDGVKFVKLDISNYFMEVGRDRINELIDKCFEDDILGIKIREMFNRDLYYYKEELTRGYLGLMPGNPLSCVLSNLILNDIDFDMMLNSYSYTRYSDDILIGEPTEKRLEEAISRIFNQLKNYSLTINNDKFKYYLDGKVEFLGLSITNTDIDINQKKLETVKSYIKKEVKYLRKEIEMKGLSKEVALNRLLRWYNRTMYKSVISNDMHIGYGGFILSNITTINSIQQIDFYFINQARHLLTGKHNGANVKALSIEELERKGYMSMCELLKYMSMGKEIYIHHVYNLI